MHRWREVPAEGAGLRVVVCLALLVLASCGGAPARHRDPSAGRDFMGVTQARCAQGDAGACRILRAMGG